MEPGEELCIVTNSTTPWTVLVGGPRGGQTVALIVGDRDTAGQRDLSMLAWRWGKVIATALPGLAGTEHQRTTAAPVLCGPRCSSSTRLGMLAPVTKELNSWRAVGIRGPGIKRRGDRSSCHRLGAGLRERLAVD
ncbi:hypothetical protein EYF80_045617 [Liparis tanakae]|uniref:Uncharacterized protein n=1 Tax=Liparis tanakae TaxID=230148 RepID=A0A4Z2FV17_9TELE|nr:hypothetical protein EYF80_045617 [Liparis tanakae]